jgi:hypothetical protein
VLSQRPLAPREPYFAVPTGTEGLSPTKSDSEVILGEDIDRFILNYTRNLADGTIFATRNVQFIHESVRGFLLKVKDLPSSGHLRGRSH